MAFFFKQIDCNLFLDILKLLIFKFCHSMNSGCYSKVKAPILLEDPKINAQHSNKCELDMVFVTSL